MAKKYISLSILNKLSNEQLDDILSKPIKILCKNFNSELQEIKDLNVLSVKNKFFWKQDDTEWSYYIHENDLVDFTDIPKEIFNGFNDYYADLLTYSSEHKVKLLQDKRDSLKKLEFQKTKKDEEISEAVVASTTDTILINKAIFEDLAKLTPENAKIQSQIVVEETSEIVKIASNLLQEFSGDYSIFSEMIQKSNGSTIKHMTRVFVMTLSYFHTFNKLINSGYVARIRADFSEKYRKKYEKLLPHITDFNSITLERVFKGGMSSVHNLESNAIGVGFLLHDIGKQVDIEYFEGSGAYNKERIQAHVTNGFNELLKRTVYPPVVSAIAGFHHEYYGYPSGYGPLRDFINRKFPEGIQCDYCISYSLKDVYNGEALCFLPAKMLEIVDVYDALTDPERKYRDPLIPAEAIEFMKKNFISSEIKLDPILFDIFELYLIESGEIKI